MTKDRTLINYQRLIILVTICCGVFFLGLGGLPSSEGSGQKAKRQENYLLAVKNDTQAFKVVELETTGPQRVRVTFRNDYAKDITAFVISPSKNKNTSNRYDFALSETNDGIAPGATYSLEVFLDGLLSRPAEEPDQTAPEELTLFIRAVVLQDDTGDGDLNFVRRVLDSRLGHKKQIERTLALLQLTLNSDYAGLSTACDNLKSRIANLPSHHEQGASVYYSEGLHNGKENAIRHLQQVEEMRKHIPYIDLREQLIKMKERYERKVRKLAVKHQ